MLDATAFKNVLSRNPKWREEMEARFLDRLRINAMIPSPVQESDWLPLFLPYVAMRDAPSSTPPS